jgi:NADPH:quinone reductase-like Zn-dependent oxidoreductase
MSSGSKAPAMTGHSLSQEDTMKAVLLTGHGAPEYLRYGDASDPAAGLGEAVIDIHAASVNAADYKMRQGGF